MPGGVAARPFVKSLSIVNDGISTPVITDGTAGGSGVGAGGVAAVISPFNLCKTGQTPAQGTCYATPNRVGLSITYVKGLNNGWDFSSPNQHATPTIDANSVIDMTVTLNTLGKSLRWSWVNGDLLYWQTTDLGQDDATVHIKFKPVTTPWVNLPADNGCTATPTFNCNIPSADGEGLGANLVFSLDDTLDPALTGAVFATQGAIAGFLSPGGTAQAPTLNIQASSTHTMSDGTPQLGTLKAFLPAAALVNLYGMLPADAAANFTTTRLGDAGTNNAPTYTPWTVADNGAEGVLVTVTDITFSVPKYRVASRLTATVSRAVARRFRTTVSTTVAKCTRARPCKVTVYNLGPKATKRWLTQRKVVLRNKRVNSSNVSVSVPVASLRRGHRYLLVVRSGATTKLFASTVGTVKRG